MAINKDQLRTLVIRPALETIDLWSEVAEELLMATAAHESSLGVYLHQINGPALGIFQIEPATHRDIHANFLRYRPTLRHEVRALASHSGRTRSGAVKDSELITNLAYATAIARLVYYRAPAGLPGNTPSGLAEYWKQHYNTISGKGNVDEFIANYLLKVK